MYKYVGLCSNIFPSGIYIMASTKTNKDEVSKKGAKTKDEETMDDQEEQPLPDGWARMFSRSKKKPYYFYVPTRKSQWQHPNSVKVK